MVDRGRSEKPAASKAGLRAYQQAHRHSSRVRFFRRVIPIGAVIAIGFVAVVAVFNPFGKIAGLTMGPISLSGTQVTMESPRLSGYRKDNRAYEVTAVAAMQDVRRPTVIELRDMKARLTLDDAGTVARLEADTGLFDTQKEQLEVRQNVRVRTDGGQEADLRSASVDLKAGTVVSNEPVTVRLPDATVEANSLNIRDSGKIITFIGNVKTVIDPGAAEARSNAA
ncbi:MAG: FIG00793979: hypothetical protein, partial [uncultured Microvirga sp.]